MDKNVIYELFKETVKKSPNAVSVFDEERCLTKIYLETSECGRSLYESLGFSDMRDYMKI